MKQDLVERFAKRVGYSETEREIFCQGGHRLRQVRRLADASQRFSVRVEVVESHHCNSGHVEGQTFLLDADGNFITKLCPKRMCVYLVSQLIIPVALINERLSEGLDPNDFHFMRQIHCLDSGVDCMGYGQVRAAVTVVPRNG